MVIRNQPDHSPARSSATKLELPLPHPQTPTTTVSRLANALITRNFDERMIWSRLIVTTQINHEQRDRSQGREQARQRNLCGIFLRLGRCCCIFMPPAPPVSGFPKFIRSRRERPLSASSLGPFLIYAAASHATAPSPPTRLPRLYSFSHHIKIFPGFYHDRTYSNMRG